MVYRRLNCSSCADVLCCRPCRGNRECCPCLIPKSAPEASRMLTFAGFLAFIGLLFVSIGLLVPVLLDRSLDRGLHQLKALDSTDSRAYKLFKSNEDYPIKLELYLYNITNTVDILEAGAIPAYQEIGPYTYFMYRDALNVTWDDEATELTYMYYTRFLFDASLSVGSDTDLMYSPNMFFWSMAGQVYYHGDESSLKIFHSMCGEKVKPHDMAFVHLPIKNVIFGYKKSEEPALACFLIPMDFPGLIKNHTSPMDAAKQSKLDTIRTGYPDIRSLHQYVAYQGHTTAIDADNKDPAWPNNPDAGLVKGSDGGAFPAPLNERSSPELFMPSFYRSINLEYKDTRTYKGIKMLRYEVPNSMWLSSEEVPENAVYNQNKWTGVLNLTDPGRKSPLYLTRPRMHKVDKNALKMASIQYLPEAKDAVPSDYESSFHVEPTISASMSVAITNQLCTIMEPFNFTYTKTDDDDEEITIETSFFPNMNMEAPLFAPIFWANQTVMVSDDDAHAFRSTVYAVFRIMQIAPIVGYCVGGFIAIIALLLALRGYRYHQLYRFEGHVFVETDNVDGNFAATDAVYKTRARRFSDAKPGRIDGGTRGESEGVNLDSLAAHQPSRRRDYGTTAAAPSGDSLSALGSRDPIAPSAGALAAMGAAGATGSVYAASSPSSAGGASSPTASGAVGEGSRSVTVDAPEVDY